MIITNTHITLEKLVATGNIVPELYYSLYLHDQWVFFKEKTQESTFYLIPICLGLEIIIQLNKTPFIIRIVHHIHNFLQPGYICEEGKQSSGIIESAFKAITSTYQLVFDSKTKYAGLSYLGLNQLETAQKLLEGVTFHPFIIELENISVFVGCFGKITWSNKNKIGHDYTASLFYKYKKIISFFSMY